MPHKSSKPKTAKTYTQNDGLSALIIDFVGNPNGVRVEHTNAGVRVVGSFPSGVHEVRLYERDARGDAVGGGPAPTGTYVEKAEDETSLAADENRDGDVRKPGKTRTGKDKG